MIQKQQLRDIAISQIMPDPSQPRKTFLDEELQRLAASLKARGVLHPLRVRWDESRQCYIIITGESRWRAGKLAEMDTLPCLVIEGELSETDILTDQIIENTVRHALPPMQEARSLAKLKALKKCNAQTLADEVGIAKSSFSRAESLLTLPEQIQEMVDSGSVPPSAAYEISRLDDAAAQFELAHLIARKAITRDKLADKVRDHLNDSGKRPKPSRLVCKYEGITISLSSGKPLTLDKLMLIIESLRKDAKNLIDGKQASKQPI